MKAQKPGKYTYRHYNFERLWKYFPLRRSFKEQLKYLLFTYFTFVFKRWVIFLNWKNAQVYRNKNLNIFTAEFWRRKFRQSYPIPIRKPEPALSGKKYNKLAIVAHVFYAYIFDEILELLSHNTAIELTLYLTGPHCIIENYKNAIPKRIKCIGFLTTNNHGRDILPFLKILPQVFADGNDLILKLHTKGSNHLNRRVHWRNDLFSKLIGKGRIDDAVNVFNANHNVGMIGPSGNILSMQNYYGSNAEIVKILSNRMGVADEMLVDLNFVAGSMFYARKEVLTPLLRLGLTEKDFEKEEGQKDGTMAHAVERLFSVGAILAGLQLADTDYNPQKPFLTVNKNHYFSS